MGTDFWREKNIILFSSLGEEEKKNPKKYTNTSF